MNGGSTQTTGPSKASLQELLETKPAVVNKLPRWHYEVGSRIQWGRDGENQRAKTDPLSFAVITLLTHTHSILYVLQGQQPTRPHALGDGGDDDDDDGRLEILPDAVLTMDLGNYQRRSVSNVDMVETGRMYFDFGLRLMMSYQHEIASKCFLACLEHCPDAALAHGLLALCHSPNYNFKGEAYYESACHFDDANQHDLLCIFPSQQVADRHSKMGVEKVEELKRRHKHSGGSSSSTSAGSGSNKGAKKKGKASANKTKAVPVNGGNTNANRVEPNGEAVESATTATTTTKTAGVISDVERQFLTAIRILTGTAGVDPGLSDETVGRPYAAAMRKIHYKYPDDPEIAYFFAESLMVLNAWQLYEYPSGKPVSADVEETRAVLERALQLHPHHAGLCHMYVHLSEMSAHPQLALIACQPLRTEFKHAGHLIHMPTHIDVLMGDYESCVRYNLQAVAADLYAMECSPATAGYESFYFGYIVVRREYAACVCKCEQQHSRAILSRHH
jgi:hypothetical protein